MENVNERLLIAFERGRNAGKLFDEMVKKIYMFCIDNKLDFNTISEEILNYWKEISNTNLENKEDKRFYKFANLQMDKEEAISIIVEFEATKRTGYKYIIKNLRSERS